MAALTLFFTSDLHLGMKFASLGEVQSDLAEARFACLGRMVRMANERHAEVFVVAGDLFERISVAKKDLQRAALLLRDFQGALVAVLPGNHDYLAPDDELWRRFKDSCGDSVLLLEERRPYPLGHYGIDACLYPGPCFSKHSKENAVAWVRGAQKDPSVSHHIGIAHGSLQGVSPDFGADYYPMSAQELLESGMEVWLLGHTHVPYPASPAPADRIFFAGTPEPDGFDCDHRGHAWLLSLSGRDMHAESVSTGAFRFEHARIDLRGAADVADLAARYVTAQSKDLLLRLSLRGRLGQDARAELPALQKRVAAAVRYLDWDERELREEISEELIAREYPQGSFPQKLLAELLAHDDAEALDLAFELLQEARR